MSNFVCKERFKKVKKKKIFVFMEMKLYVCHNNSKSPIKYLISSHILIGKNSCHLMRRNFNLQNLMITRNYYSFRWPFGFLPKYLIVFFHLYSFSKIFANKQMYATLLKSWLCVKLYIQYILFYLYTLW